MAILRSAPPPTPCAPPPCGPGLFVVTAVPSGFVTSSLALPCGSLLESTETHLNLYISDRRTSALVPQTPTPVFSRIRALALSCHGVVLALAAESRLSFLETADVPEGKTLVVRGSLYLFGVPSDGMSERLDARLLAAHPRRALGAVATAAGTVAVFPVLALSARVSAGKVVSAPVDGAVLSIAFLEDDGGERDAAVLIALVQTRGKQRVAVFAVREVLNAGLRITLVGNAVTGATRWEDVAVARATRKLTGREVPRPRAATEVASVPGCPFGFVVCAEGRVVVADARFVLRKGEEGGRGDGRYWKEWDEGREDREARAASAAAFGGGKGSAADRDDSSSRERRRSNAVIGDREGEASGSAGRVEGSRRVSMGGSSDLATASQVDTAAVNSGDLLSSCPDDSVTADGEDVVAATASTAVEMAEAADMAPEATLAQQVLAGTLANTNTVAAVTTPDTVLGVGMNTLASVGESAWNLAPGARASSAGSSASAPRLKSLREAGLDPFFSSSMCVPPHIALDVGDGDEGFVTAMCLAGSHRSAGGSDGDESGIYMVMESGRLYVLRCRSHTRADGVPSLVIPKPSGTNTGLAAPGTDGSKLSPYFSLEALGHVGPASTIAALDSGLLYISNDGADGSLRLVVPPSRQGRPYGLLLRQQFLNLAPVSDFVIVPGCKSLPQTTHSPSGAVSTVDLASAQPEKERSGKKIPEKKRTAKERAEKERTISEECSLLVCSGIGEHGTVRSLKAGAAVSVFASSEDTFVGCNGVWGVRAARASRFHTFLVVTFAEATGVLCIACAPPATPGDSASGTNDAFDEQTQSPSVARLLDASAASEMLLDRRTLACGLLRDGVLVQVHRDGVRFMELRKVGVSAGRAEEVNLAPLSGNGHGESVAGTLVERTFDWCPPSGMFVSAGCVGFGNVVISLRQSGEPSRLVQLGGGEGGDESFVEVISSIIITDEVCALHVVDESDSMLLGVGSKANALVVATYGPTIEVRSLTEGLSLLTSCPIEPWASDAVPTNLVDPSTPLQPRIGVLPQATSRLYAEQAASVAESLCTVEVDRQFIVVVGLRDGYLLTFSLSMESQELTTVPGASIALGGVSGAAGRGTTLRFLNRRRLGGKPVRVTSALVASGKSVLAECERPWVGRLSRGTTMNWMPLNFEETNAATALSCAGAERCIALVSASGSLSICGSRRSTPVSIRTLRVGDTPRRAIALDSAMDFIAVSTSPGSSEKSSGDVQDSPRRSRFSMPPITDSEKSMFERERRTTSRFSGVGSGGSDGAMAMLSSDLRLYDFRTQALVSRVCFLPDELVHVLVSWQGFLVVGTSFEIRQKYAEGKDACDHGRLLLFSHDCRRVPTEGEKTLEESCQVLLPGAILAGAVNESETCLVVSCNEHIFVFVLTADGNGLCEVARTKTRGIVVSLSVRKSLVCAANRKDSVAFYRVSVDTRSLVRCRGDFRTRNVADAVLVDDLSALATDRQGHIFSLAYDKRDQPRLSSNDRDPAIPGAVLSNIMGLLFSEPKVTGPGASIVENTIEGSFTVADEGNTEDGDPETGDVGTGSAVNTGVDLEGNGGGMEEGMRGANNSDDDESVAMDTAIEAAIAEGDGESLSDDDISLPITARSASDTDEDEEDQVDLSSSDDDHNGGNDGVEDEQDESEGSHDHEDGNGGSDVLVSNTEAEESLVFQGQQPVQRHLVCDHAYGLNDVALRVRFGSIARRESRNNWEDSKSFWSSTGFAVVAGTLSGAVVVAIPVGKEATSVLQRLSKELVLHPSVLSSTLGSSHDRFRSAFGKSMLGTLDGDLLKHFCLLGPEDQECIAAAAGFPGRKNAEMFVDMIDSFWDRAI